MRILLGHTQVGDFTKLTKIILQIFFRDFWGDTGHEATIVRFVLLGRD